jgi:hypothetical protein
MHEEREMQSATILQELEQLERVLLLHSETAAASHIRLASDFSRLAWATQVHELQVALHAEAVGWLIKAQQAIAGARGHDAVSLH